MDKETAIFVTVFLTICVGLLSLLFPKKDRIKVFFVAGGFAGLFTTTILLLWLIKEIIPKSFSWAGYIMGFLAYSFLLGFFGLKMGMLADQKNHQPANKEAERNA